LIIEDCNNAKIELTHLILAPQYPRTCPNYENMRLSKLTIPSTHCVNCSSTYRKVSQIFLGCKNYSINKCGIIKKKLLKISLQYIVNKQIQLFKFLKSKLSCIRWWLDDECVPTFKQFLDVPCGNRISRMSLYNVRPV